MRQASARMLAGCVLETLPAMQTIVRMAEDIPLDDPYDRVENVVRIARAVEQHLRGQVRYVLEPWTPFVGVQPIRLAPLLLG